MKSSRPTFPGAGNKSSSLEHLNPNDIRATMLQVILSRLDHSGISYAVLNCDGERFPQTSSDVDIVLGQDPMHAIEPVLIGLQEEGRIKIIQKLYYEIPAGYYYIIGTEPSHVTPANLLHLDCLYDPYGVNSYFIPTSYFLSDCVKESWGYRVCNKKMALYMLIKKAIKRTVPDSQFTTLQHLVRRYVIDDGANIEKWFGKKTAPLLESLASFPGCSDCNVLPLLKKKLLRTMWSTHPFLRVYSALLSAVRKCGRFLKPTGIFIVFLGPDGVGKSTISQATKKCHARTFRHLWWFHWRPGLLPRLGRLAGHNPVTACTKPPSEVAYGTFVSLIRYIYYLADFVLGYWLVIYPKRAQTTLVVGERWYYDVMVNPMRYGFNLPPWLLSAGKKLIPRPDLILLITADPETIYRRKAELEIAEIRRQIKTFRAILPPCPHGYEVVNQDKAGSPLRHISAAIVEYVSANTSRRMNKASRPSWFCFGNRDSVKVWINRHDSVRNALRLYQPYSNKGLLSKYLAERLPSSLAKLLLIHKEPTSVEASKLAMHEQVIFDALGETGSAISFAVGTPGPHQKLTAQVSKAGCLRAYVKIAPEAIIGLLVNEKRQLENIRSNVSSTWRFPHVLNFVVTNGYAYLFLSPSNCSIARCPIEIGDLDSRFLAEAIPKVPEHAPLEDVFTWNGSPISSESKSGNDHDSFWLTVANTVRAILGETVLIAPCHGDYAPWNTFRQEDGLLYVIDWEYAFDKAPLFFDLFHRILMPERMVRSSPPHRVVQEIQRVYRSEHLTGVLLRTAMTYEAFMAYFLIYLRVISRRKTEDHGFKSFVMECAGIVVKRVETLRRRKKILVSAYACEPDKGSEPGVGWHWVEAISNENEAWVITKSNNRDSIEAHLRTHPVPGLHFEYVEVPRWLSFWKKGPRGIRTYYYIWQFFALAKGMSLHQKVRFDIGHHVTFVNDWLWSFFALMPIPFVWGPIGSNSKLPRPLIPGLKNRLGNTARYMFQSGIRMLDPLYWLTAARASMILCINRGIAERWPLRIIGRKKILVEPAIGVEELLCRPQSTGRHTYSVLFVGHFIAIKGPMIALDAFASFAENRTDCTLTMIGCGPEKTHLLKRIGELGIADKVSIVDWMPREMVLKEFLKHDVFLFPSMEGGGMVVIEAMASGLPVICLDYGGPGEAVDEVTGIKVRPGERWIVVKQLSDALFTVMEKDGSSPYCHSSIRAATLSRFGWSYKVRTIRYAYSHAN